MSPPDPFGLLARAVAATESNNIAPTITARPRLTMIPSFRSNRARGAVLPLRLGASQVLRAGMVEGCCETVTVARGSGPETSSRQGPDGACPQALAEIGRAHV